MMKSNADIYREALVTASGVQLKRGLREIYEQVRGQDNDSKNQRES